MKKGVIILEVKDLGNVPGFKNSKLLTRGRLVTKPEFQKWMQNCTDSFVVQLNSGLATIAAGMPMDAPAPSLIALLRQLRGLDDSRQWIPEQHIYCEAVEKGFEGAEMTIEQI